MGIINRTFLSETIRHKALLFFMQQYLLYFYQVCSYNNSGAKNDHAFFSNVFNRLLSYGVTVIQWITSCHK